MEMHPEPMSFFATPEMAGGDGADGELATLAAPVALAAQPLRSEAVNPDDPATWGATPRNAPCPCGSGKKYKHCHGKLG